MFLEVFSACVVRFGRCGIADAVGLHRRALFLQPLCASFWRMRACPYCRPSIGVAGVLVRPAFSAVPPPSYNGGVMAAGPLTVTVPVGLEAGPEFNLPGRLRGPGAPSPRLASFLQPNMPWP